MPPRKSVRSLEHFCVQSIAYNLCKFKPRAADAWRRIPSYYPIALYSREDITEDEPSRRYFDILPSELLVSIMDVVVQTDWSSRDMRQLIVLVTPHLETLNLKHCGSYNSGRCEYVDEIFHQLIRTAALRHSPLKSLECCLKRPLLPVSFEDLLPAFPNLIKLDVSYSSSTNINDNVLSLVAKNCKQLQVLRLEGCCGVTDVGIQQLCGLQEGEEDTGAGCKLLIQLDIQKTRVTRYGARLALEHLPRLEIFDYPSSVQTAAEMYRTNRSLHQLNLKNLNAIYGLSLYEDEVPYVKGNLMEAVRLCPSVVNVHLSFIESLDDDDLAALLNLNCLQNLTVEKCQGTSFDGGLEPILRKFGPLSLESLTLASVENVNIRSIVEFCSNLRVLELFHINQDYHRLGLEPNRQLLLPHLSRLTVEGYFSGFPAIRHQLSEADLLLLLGSAPALEKLRMFGVHNLSDGIVEEAMAVHGFPNLESFQVECCPRITKGIVDRLLGLDNNPLSWICVEKFRPFKMCCKKEKNYYAAADPCCGYSWERKILENQWDLKIHYCECSSSTEMAYEGIMYLDDTTIIVVIGMVFIAILLIMIMKL